MGNSSKIYINSITSNPLTIIDSNDNVTHYIYGPKGIVAKRNESLTYYLLKDHLGSTRVVMNENNQAISSYDYDAWGNPMNSTVSEESAYRYTGREYDDETGLHNFRARLYDSTLMRFYQVDPAEQFASPYVYCGNNPIMQLDFTGKFSEKIQQAAKEYNNIPYVGFECNVYVYTAVTKGEGWTDFPRNLWDLDGGIGQATYYKQKNVLYENIDQAWAVLDVGEVIISGGGYYPSGGHTMIVDEVTYNDKGNKTGFYVTGAWSKGTNSGRGRYSYRSIQHYLDKVPVNPNFWGLASLNNNEVPIGRDSDYSKSKSSSAKGSAIPDLDDEPYDRINPRDFGVPGNCGWGSILDDWTLPPVQ